MKDDTPLGLVGKVPKNGVEDLKLDFKIHKLLKTQNDLGVKGGHVPP